jgi:glycosyltransferase involved in cell wall biosynthesis
VKILHVIDGLGTGGAERSLSEILPRLEHYGVESAIAFFRSRDEGVEHSIRERDFATHLLRGRTLVGRVRALRRLLAEFAPDLVHSALFEATLLTRFATRTRVPVLTSLVSTPYAPARLLDPNVHRVKLEFVRLVDGWTGRHWTTHFHAITHAVKDAAVASFGVDPAAVTVIERGRDEARLGRGGMTRRTAARRSLCLGDDDQVVVNVARQEFLKGHRYLIQAMPRVIDSHPNAVLLVAGRKGHASRELEALLESSPVADRIRFLGHRDDVPEILAAADLYVSPSLIEGLGGAVIEAMALSLPVVATDLPATREVVEKGRNALLVPPASPEVLGDAIAALLENPARRWTFGEASRQIFEERFTLEMSVTRLVELYARVAGLPHPKEHFEEAQWSTMS